ncbi:MAG: transcription antitermination factor NusB [Candidatus Dojkabacteria bacterium]|uniref:Transcription antitermination protein NusB n=2 Tax=Candidatus Dojkabacteria TaxID=74243 RepID=A0A136KEY9_9BACT|nr:MAG: hypothetical protein UZ20_WS6002001034 [candidate division WS6 bacterium OLB21]MBW7953177.1 transcription antitermination factor NusB [Candidatus Dojkabacteria bacterium]WKZ28324.1 MAG: transcription antitermination factor NusB [Candidatus Dojkabacteria bacterium]
MASSDPRHNARVVALQKLFNESFFDVSLVNSKSTSFDDSSLNSINEIPDEEVDYKLLESIYSGVSRNLTEIDSIISKLAPQWPIDHIAKTDLQILRIAIYEGFIAKLTPEKVAVDEAIELAKEFSNEKSRMFINGALGNLIVNKSDFGF